MTVQGHPKSDLCQLSVTTVYAWRPTSSGAHFLDFCCA